MVPSGLVRRFGLLFALWSVTRPAATMIGPKLARTIETSPPRAKLAGAKASLFAVPIGWCGMHLLTMLTSLAACLIRHLFFVQLAEDISQARVGFGQ